MDQCHKTKEKWGIAMDTPKWRIHYHMNKNKIEHVVCNTDEKVLEFKEYLKENGFKLLKVESIYKAEEELS